MKQQCNPIVYLGLQIPQPMLEYIVLTIDELDLDSKLSPAEIRRDEGWVVNNETRRTNSKSIHASNWIAGMLWHHVMRTNHHNFQYDITGWDSDQIEYLSYDTGGFYKWHHDDILPMYQPPTPAIHELDYKPLEYNRKLSFSLLLNDDYEGGELQLLYPPHTFCKVPKEKGHLVIFDSRVQHRVNPVKNGTRQSLVGWAVGPRWR